MCVQSVHISRWMNHDPGWSWIMSSGSEVVFVFSSACQWDSHAGLMCVQCVALGAGVCLQQRWIRAGSQQDHAGLQSSDQTTQHTPVARPAVSINSHTHTHWYIQPMHTNELVRRCSTKDWRRRRKLFYIDYLLHTHLHHTTGLLANWSNQFPQI